jgi:hypothetical protein
MAFSSSLSCAAPEVTTRSGPLQSGDGQGFTLWLSDLAGAPQFTMLGTLSSFQPSRLKIPSGYCPTSHTRYPFVHYPPAPSSPFSSTVASCSFKQDLVSSWYQVPLLRYPCHITRGFSQCLRAGFPHYPYSPMRGTGQGEPRPCVVIRSGASREDYRLLLACSRGEDRRPPLGTPGVGPPVTEAKELQLIDSS